MGSFFSGPAVVGHRGYPKAARENTLESIGAALAAGVDAVEVDVQRTADGVVVLSHDEDLSRVFGVRLNVRSATYAEAREAAGGALATLEEALALVGGRVPLLVEVKRPEDAEAAAAVVRREARDWAVLISFHEEALARAEGVAKGLVYARPPGKAVEARRLGCSLVLPHFRLATERAVALAHRLGLQVVAWTVNDAQTALELWGRGVDAVATDDAPALVAARGRPSSGQAAP